MSRVLEMTYKMDVPCHRCDTRKTPQLLNSHERDEKQQTKSFRGIATLVTSPYKQNIDVKEESNIILRS